MHGVLLQPAVHTRAQSRRSRHRARFREPQRCKSRLSFRTFAKQNIALNGPEQCSCKSHQATKQVQPQTDPSTGHKKAKFGASVGIHQLFKMLRNSRGGSKRPDAINSLNALSKPGQNRRSAGAVYFLHKQHLSSNKSGRAERKCDTQT